jgi:hypothetical protein
MHLESPGLQARAGTVELMTTWTEWEQRTAGRGGGGGAKCLAVHLTPKRP